MLGILLKVVEYGLPATLLHFYRVLVLCFKALGDVRLVTISGKFQPYPAAIAQGIFQYLILGYYIVYAAKVKAEAAILCGHSCAECTAYAHIVLCLWCMPVV